MSLTECKLIALPRIQDIRGNLTYIENNQNLPFKIQRVYYVYDVPTNIERGGHAHRGLHQMIMPISGSFDMILDDGMQTNVFHLNQPSVGLYICPMIWRRLYNFSNNSVCLVLASELYDEKDYFRSYDEFMAAVRECKQ